MKGQGQAPLPVNVLCGYLGAGKTTRLNRLLSQATERIAVMVNDFGAVQIDAELIAGAAGGVVRLTNGCVCCSMDGDLFRGFDRIFALRAEIDRLVIEASGVAEPQRLTTLAFAEPDLDCQRVVTVVCARSFRERLRDPLTSRIVEAQVEGADLVLLSRIDTSEPQQAEQVRSLIRAFNPSVRECTELDSALLAGPHRKVRHGARRRSHSEQFGAIVVDMPGPVDRAAFEGFFAAVPDGLHRAKGFVRFSDQGQLFLFQYAAGELRLDPQSEARSGVAVLIGPSLSMAALRQDLDARLCDVAH